jgi:hypothetical protein
MEDISDHSFGNMVPDHRWFGHDAGMGGDQLPEPGYEAETYKRNTAARNASRD